MATPEKIVAGVLVEITNAKGKTILGKLGEVLLNSSGTWQVDVVNRETNELIFTLKVGIDD
jgi:hypothetical protein